MDNNLEKTEEKTLGKHLDHLVSSSNDVTDGIRELPEIMLDDALSVSLQPLDVKKSHPPEDEKTRKRKTRRGTRGKGRKIIYNKDKRLNDKLDGQRGSKGSSGAKNNVKNCTHESKEVVHPRQVPLEWDGQSDDVPHTLTFWKTGWTEKTAAEGLHWWQENIQSCTHECSEVVRPRRVHLERDGGSNDIPHTLTVWKTGWTEETAAEGLHWWQENIQSCTHECSEVVRPRRVHLERDGGSNDIPHTLTVWKTGWTEETAAEGLRWWQENIKSCTHECSEVVRPRRVHLERDGGSNDIPLTLTVWKTGWTEETAAEGLRWWQENVKTFDVGRSWAQEEAGDVGVPWFNLIYWRTGFFLNGANEHLLPENRIKRDTKNQRETENPRETENRRETENPRKTENPRD
ncbi:hypothetical protein MHYP_G00262570 [Metynnis hypsauchen]